MLVKTFGGAVYGINAFSITIEVNILPGAKFLIVGLPDNAVKESQQRIDSALREIGADAVLIGETLMRAPDKKARLAKLRGDL